ncbi:MAG: RNA polymerase sigma factor [Candidatus Limnocylindria bacterium]
MDRQLVQRAQRGDRDAFASVAGGISDRLYAVAHRILRDPEAAGDAVQVALVRIWRDLPRLREPDRLEAWAHRILVRTCHDELRKRRGLPVVLQLLPQDGVTHDSAHAVLQRDELERAFRDLSIEHRAVVVLHYYRDMTLSEIAEALSIPVGTVRSRLHYARRSLRAAIEAGSRAAPSRGSTA